MLLFEEAVEEEVEVVVSVEASRLEASRTGSCRVLVAFPVCNTDCCCQLPIFVVAAAAAVATVIGMAGVVALRVVAAATGGVGAAAVTGAAVNGVAVVVGVVAVVAVAVAEA